MIRPQLILVQVVHRPRYLDGNLQFVLKAGIVLAFLVRTPEDVR